MYIIHMEAASLGLAHEIYYPADDGLVVANHCDAMTSFPPPAGMSGDDDYFPGDLGARTPPDFYTPAQAVFSNNNQMNPCGRSFDDGRMISTMINGAANGHRQPPPRSRIGFRTRSDVDVLDDGFRWRKYGKKAVKSSPNPRNYYRCSVEGCGVKKRVERDPDDPRYVLTTYDGVHNHAVAGGGHHGAAPSTRQQVTSSS